LESFDKKQNPRLKDAACWFYLGLQGQQNSRVRVAAICQSTGSTSAETLKEKCVLVGSDVYDDYEVTEALLKQSGRNWKET